MLRWAKSDLYQNVLEVLRPQLKLVAILFQRLRKDIYSAMGMLCGYVYSPDPFASLCGTRPTPEVRTRTSLRDSTRRKYG